MEEIYDDSGELGLGAGRIDDIGVESNGNLYLPAQTGTSIGVLESGTGGVREFGREGEGPGELLGAVTVALDASGRVWTYDSRQRRLSRFERDGAFLESRTVPSGHRSGFVGGDRWVTIETSFLSPALERSRWTVQVRSAEGDSLELFSADVRTPQARLERPGLRVVMSQRWLPQTYHDFNSAGDGFALVFARAATSEGAPLTVLAIWSDEHLERTLLLPAVPGSSELENEVVAGVMEQAEEGFPFEASEIREALIMPEWLPGARDLVLGADRVVWIRAPGSVEDNHWIAIDLDRGALGTVDLPERAQLLHADEDELWIVEPDALFAPVFSRLRIVR